MQSGEESQHNLRPDQEIDHSSGQLALNESLAADSHQENTIIAASMVDDRKQEKSAPQCRVKLPLRKRIELIRLYATCNRDATKAVELFLKTQPVSKGVTADYLQAIISEFIKAGRVYAQITSTTYERRVKNILTFRILRRLRPFTEKRQGIQFVKVNSGTNDYSVQVDVDPSTDSNSTSSSDAIKEACIQTDSGTNSSNENSADMMENISVQIDVDPSFIWQTECEQRDVDANLGSSSSSTDQTEEASVQVPVIPEANSEISPDSTHDQCYQEAVYDTSSRRSTDGSHSGTETDANSGTTTPATLDDAYTESSTEAQSSSRICREYERRYNIENAAELSLQRQREENLLRRMQFCSWYLANGNTEYTLFTDEAIFYLNGSMMTSQFWESMHPNCCQRSRTQYSDRVIVWIGLLGCKLIGPYFFNDYVTGKSYLYMLENYVCPFLRKLPSADRKQICYQLDAAPPHQKPEVQDFLNKEFPRRWFGKGGPRDWPARSPDLNPVSFFLWPQLRALIYRNRPKTIEELKENLIKECRNFPLRAGLRVQQLTIKRMQLCESELGGYFIHLL